LTTPCTGRTRFALCSRKPMKRVRRRNAVESLSNGFKSRRPIQPSMAQPSPAVSSGGSSPSCVPLELGKKLRKEAYHGIPRNTLTVELSSSNWVPFETRPNIGTMLQHCKDPLQLQNPNSSRLRVVFDQLVDSHNVASGNGFENFEVLRKGIKLYSMRV
jgi:hypothetical protein